MNPQYQALIDRSLSLSEAETYLYKEVQRTFEGKRVRITSNWNGLPYGKSKPSLTGRTFLIKYAYIDSGQIYFQLDCFSDHTIYLDEVEILP